MKKRTFLILLTMILMVEQSQAQGRLGAFVGAGTMWYTGDLQENAWPHPRTIRWTANAGLHWQITKRWGLQLNYTIGEILADDQFATSDFRLNRDLRFQSFIHEIGLRGTFDILPNDKWKVLPYITAGVGALYVEPQSGGQALRPMNNEGANYSAWTLGIPTGAGVKWQINCEWAIKAEALYHWTISDYLDDVSQRGNPKWDDGLWDINAGVIFFFTGCGRTKKGGLIEDCEKMYKDVDLQELKDMYGQ